MTDKFVIPPDQSGFSFGDGKEVISTELEGGAGRYRRDVLNASFKLNVQWTLNRVDYTYFRNFYRGVTISGSIPFLIDIYADRGEELTEHTVYFVPESVRLNSQSGQTFVVSATLEVIPKIADTNLMSLEAAMYAGFGANWQYYEDILNTLVNTTIPDDLP